MKRLATTLTLLLAGLVLAQPSVLPADGRFDTPVSLQFDDSLDTVVEALAKSVGLQPILSRVPDARVYYNIEEPTGFRTVWNTVMALNDLDFALRENDIIVIGPAEDIGKLRELDLAALRSAGEPGAAGAPLREFYQVQGNAEEMAELLGRAVPGAVVEVLPGVRTLLISATAGEHERISELLARFDEPPVEIEFRTYRLSNAEATDLARVLNDSQAALFRAASREAGEGEDGEGGDAGDQRDQDGLFTVSADVRTNSLVVTAPAGVQRQVEALIEELDIRQRQVNVQVRLQEIQTRTADRLGINIAGGVGRFSASILDGGLRFLFDPHGAVSAFNIGAVLDTLETQGLSRRVDDSSLTVLNNNRTSIQAGGTILITLAGQAENIERTIPYGVQIDVTPRVSNDDRVTLEIEARVEDLLSSTEDPRMLELSTRAVLSTVTIEPGQTVLLSGLMQNQYTETVNKVPVLGDLPVIGALFRSSLAELSETELLIIVTADVLD